MLNKIYIGNYYPINSKIHSMNPVSKLLCTIIFIAMTFICKDIRLMLLLSFLCVLMIEMAHLPRMIYLKTFSSIKFLIVFLIIIYYFVGTDLESIINMILRLYVIVLYTTMVTLTTPPNEITYGLQIVMTPLKLIGIPVNKIALSISLALRFIPTIIDQGNKIMKSQASRGIDYYASNVSGKILAIKSMLLPMFILTIRRADALAEAMQIRLYNINGRRTNFRINKWGFFDT
ncbi:MAG TPA: energy-coupling factor transporter transmembrane protein EcfT, partial [Bacilli bacterium]|nr:energy-coupling factor transporter transmembrane protein EcfT [Bacilli bacterium]